MLHAWPSIQYREDTEDYLVLLPAKLERLAAKNTQAQTQAEIRAGFFCESTDGGLSYPAGHVVSR
jgi:hypothetical protein